MFYNKIEYKRGLLKEGFRGTLRGLFKMQFCYLKSILIIKVYHCPNNFIEIKKLIIIKLR
jgi:hypothetical protein